MEKPKRIRRPYLKEIDSRGGNEFYQTKAWRDFRRSLFIEQRRDDIKISYNFYKDNPEVELSEYNKYLDSSNPLCVHCLKEKRIKAANTADHIVPIKDGGGKFDPANIQWLCESHHAKKSAKEKR